MAIAKATLAIYVEWPPGFLEKKIYLRHGYRLYLHNEDVVKYQRFPISFRPK